MKSEKSKKIKSVSDSGIVVATAVSFIPDQSDLKGQKFIWVYEISIRNHSEQIVQLLTRFWRIIDMSGKIEEIRGIGVIGLQPIIKPGREFVYTSFCQLSTPQGTMEGKFEMQNLDDERFEVP